MIFKLIKEPELINWSGNPISYVIACSPYGAVQAAQDIRIQLTLQVEVFRASGIYHDIKTETLTPNENGLTQITVSSLADAYLKFHFPQLNTLASGRCDSQSRYFRLKWRTYVGGQLSAPEHSDPCIIVKGGLPYDGAKNFDSWMEAFSGKFIYLNTNHTYDPQQPAFASFLYKDAAEIETPTFDFTIRLAGVDTTTTHAMPFNLRQGDIFYVPLQKLAAQDATGQLSIGTISYKNDAAAVLQQFVFSYEPRRFFKCADLLFINSLGAIDSIRLYGELGSTGEYEQSMASLATPFTGNKEMLPAGIEEVNSSVQTKFTGNTGFVGAGDHDLLKALMLNKKAWLVNSNSTLLPVIVTKKTLPGPLSTSFLFDAQLEWTEASRHSFFAQLSQGAYEEPACPALIFFKAEQETSTGIRITWSCPQPYKNLQIKIFNANPLLDEYTELEGAFGSQLLTTAHTGDITVQGRLICGLITSLDGTTEPSLGPAATEAITMTANRMPAAINDQFESTVGHATPQLLAGNLLTNDFDPDGDAIEVVAASGPTLQGGWYSITADGKVYYTAPYPAYTGTDRFSYKIKETVSGVESGLATAFITMMAGGSSEVVYAKVFYSNPIGSGNPNVNRTSDVFIKTYADPLCTVPKDVSLMNISFNYKKKVTLKNVSTGAAPTITETTHFVLGVGVQNLIFSGLIVRVGMLTNSLYIYRETTEFILQTGNGYIIG